MVGIWILLTLVLSFSLPAVNDVEDNMAENLPKSTMSQKAEKIIKKEFPNDSGSPLLIVWNRENGLSKEDYQDIQEIYKQLRSEPLSHQSSLPPFDTLPIPVMTKSSSEDGTTIITPIFFDKKTKVEVLQKNLDKLQNRITNTLDDNPLERKLSDSGLHVRLSGPVGIQTDAVSLFTQADIKLLISTVLLVLVFLILLYRSPFLAIVPLIVVGFAYNKSLVSLLGK